MNKILTLIFGIMILSVSLVSAVGESITIIKPIDNEVLNNSGTYFFKWSTIGANMPWHTHHFEYKKDNGNWITETSNLGYNSRILNFNLNKEIGDYQVRISLWDGSNKLAEDIVNFKISSNGMIEQEKTYFRFKDNTCNGIILLPSQKTINDYIDWKECEKNIIVPQPVKPTPTSWEFIKSKISSFLIYLANIFSQKQLTITGQQLVEPNTQQTYQIDLSTTLPDKDYSDGNASWQWGNWALIDSSNTIKQQGQWEEINGRYTKSVTIKTPSDIGDYMLIALITQKNATYDYVTKTWTYGVDEILNKEGIDLTSKFVVIQPTKPTPTPINNLINLLKTFFCSKFGWFC